MPSAAKSSGPPCVERHVVAYIDQAGASAKVWSADIAA
jgi:hypothetical protein